MTRAVAIDATVADVWPVVGPGASGGSSTAVEAGPTRLDAMRGVHPGEPRHDHSMGDRGVESPETDTNANDSDRTRSHRPGSPPAASQESSQRWTSDFEALLEGGHPGSSWRDDDRPGVVKGRRLMSICTQITT
jgi:hypothetical protein